MDVPIPKRSRSTSPSWIRLAAPGNDPITIRSDEHPAYPRALRRLRPRAVRHECTPSIEARTARNPLFPVNLLDLLLRHNSANHKRETIAFSKRHQAVVERAALLLLWRNYGKRFSENHGGGTPAMRLGASRRPFGVRALLEQRAFPSRVPMPEVWQDYYRRRVPTAEIERPQEHRLTRAF